MNITISEFELHDDQINFEVITSDFHETYVFPWNFSVSCNLKINDQTFYLQFDTGCSYYMNDYNLPNQDLELSECGTDELIFKISSVCEDDLENDAFAKEMLEEFSPAYPFLDSQEKLLELYHVINEIRPRIDEFLDDDELNPDNYVQDEETLEWSYTLQNKE